jgi:hypothetical protein
MNERQRKETSMRFRPPHGLKANQRLITKSNYLLSARQIQRLIDEGQIACPNCGGKEIVWACCKTKVTDPTFLKKLAKEVNQSEH